MSDIPPTNIALKSPADAGFALLSAHREGRTTLTRRSAQYCGQLVAAHEPLTDAQERWLLQMCQKAGFEAPFLGEA